MKTGFSVVPFAAAFVASALACSSSPTPPPPDSTIATFCSDWATAYCKVSNQCQFDPTVCAAYQTTVCQSFVAAAEASGTRRYSQPAGEACIRAINGVFGSGPSSVSAASLATLNTACNEAFTGDQALNQSCTGLYDCAGTNVCAPVLGGSGNVCASATQKALGQPCGDPGDECQGDSYCATSDAGYPICTATPPAGGPCSATMPCGSNDHCLSGTCQPLATNGQACSTNADCASSSPYCDPYPPAECVVGMVFGGRNSADCNLIIGNLPDGGATPADAASGG